ncbi:hypothetical protein [Pseudaeromonas paramecii]|uniref:Uncharacterized protein n=1 Tax=Pseudaeromonas paramecii TaxID=2138166 RepID=A0ABP8QDG1_9GAMM
MANVYEKLAIILAVIMCLPVCVAISGGVAFLDKSNPVYYEGLHVVGYMVILSSVIWIPYLILSALKWKKISSKVQAVTFIPIGSMLSLALVAEINGVPW